MSKVPARRNNEYRLSFAYSHAAGQGNDDSPTTQNNWIVQRTEDGSGIYYFNPSTGEMKINNDSKLQQPSLIDKVDLVSDSTLILDSEYESDHISNIDMPSWSDQSTLHSIDDKVNTAV